MSNNDEDRADYDDRREHGDWKSRYTRPAWFRIVMEFVLLFAYLIGASYLLIDAVVEKPEELSKQGFVYLSPLGVSISNEVAKWMALAMAGFIGGTVVDLKWLYHSVAKGLWNQDRCLWRIIVPFNSAAISLFTGFLFASGSIPFLQNESFEDLYTLLGFGFVFGYFSDNILAALQNLARQVFGTLKDR